MASRKRSALLYITRLDYERTHAWWVRITAVNRKPGEPRLADSKMFSDGRWGGQQKALRAAQKWRDAALKKYPRPECYRRGGIPVPPGYGYIRFSLRRYYPRGSKTFVLEPAWVSWLRIEDRQHKGTSISISRWGRKPAWERMEAWLERERRALARRLGISYSKLLTIANRREF